MKKLLLLFLLLWLLAQNATAEDVSSEKCVNNSFGIPDRAALFDMDMESTQQLLENASVTFSARNGISGIYLVFDLPYGELVLSGGGRAIRVDTGGVLHCYLDVEKDLGCAPRTMTLCFPNGEASLNELRIFSPGELPDWVQCWRKIPAGEADLLLLSTHGDDEQLFFAGLLPWYAAEQGKRVQVVYFTDHRNMVPYRVHEMLNGLWAVGVRDYPVFGAFPDYYTFDREDAYDFYENQGYSKRDLLAFVVENLRYYRPLVAVGHDVEGEYGHGMHQLTADLLMQAAEAAGETQQFPDSAEQYGTYQVPKTYLHLYGENQIVMNWDIPLERFGGKTAYEVTRDLGFAAHESQLADFAWYFHGANRASEVERYSPCKFGLYQSIVGPDVTGGDFFENLPQAYELEIQPSVQPTSQFPTTHPTAAPSEVQQSAPAPAASLNAEETWPAIPAAGTAALAAAVACYTAKMRKENFDNF